MHPWEDFAETFAHLLHIVDALATIDSFGLRMTEWPDADEHHAIDFDPYAAATEQLVGKWGPFAFAANAINRAMGQPDLYPFQLPAVVVGKLDYINRLVRRAASGAIEDAPSSSRKSEAEIA
jgi:hypothetical protein